MSLSKILIITISFLVMGCNGPSQNRSRLSTAPASVQSQQVTAEIKRARVDLVGPDGNSGVKEVIQKITPDTVEVGKATAVAGIDSAVGHIDVAATQSAATEKTSKADEARILELQNENASLKNQIAEAERNEPLAKNSQRGAIAALVAMVLLVGIGLWKDITLLQVVGFCCGGISAALFVAARVIQAFNAIPNWVIVLSVLLILGGAAAVAYFLHRKTHATDSKYVLKPNPGTP